MPNPRVIKTKVKDMKELIGKKKKRRRDYIRLIGLICIGYGVFLVHPGLCWVVLGGAILFLSRK